MILNKHNQSFASEQQTLRVTFSDKFVHTGTRNIVYLTIGESEAADTSELDRTGYYSVISACV